MKLTSASICALEQRRILSVLWQFWGAGISEVLPDVKLTFDFSLYFPIDCFEWALIRTDCFEWALIVVIEQ